MEVGRKRSKVDGDTTIHSGLEAPWPSSPVRPPKFDLYCYNHETDRRFITNACTLYAIRKVFDEVVGENEYEVHGDTIKFGEIDVMSNEMDEILAHRYTKTEAEWELPSPYPQEVARFLNGSRMSAQLIDETRGRLPPTPSSKPKIDRTGLTSIQELCEEMKVEPRDARAALRKAKMQKPAGGWLFKPDEVDAIKKIIGSVK